MHNKIVIVGAGPCGVTLSNLFAKKKINTLILDTRDHIGGNCYDYFHNGVLVHKYGPHYFRTNSKKLIKYLSEFTEWIPGNYVAKSYVKNDLYDFPINLNTLEKYFKVKLTPKNVKSFINSLKENIKKPKNSKEFILSRVGKEIYENFYKNYTYKQWGVYPEKLATNVCGRVPIYFNRKQSYAIEKNNLMPKKGFTKMFKNMLDSKFINIELGVKKDTYKKYIDKHTLFYTGPIDSYFNYKFGKLGWRSLNFKFETHKKKFYQNFCQINFPNNYKFTRKIEYKHVTGQKINKTVISKEYPKDTGDPYYPVPNITNQRLYKKYEALKLLENKKNVYFIGRLANYTYINTDQAMLSAIKLFNEYIKKQI